MKENIASRIDELDLQQVHDLISTQINDNVLNNIWWVAAL